MAKRFEGKVAFITGAARGQGRNHALRLAAEGADIIALDVCAPIDDLEYPAGTETEFKETIAAVEGLGRRIVAEVCDVRDLEGMKSLVARGFAELGRLDIVVANAGVAMLFPWHETTPEIMRTTIDINLVGCWNTAMAALPHMIEAGNGGSLIFISSTNGIKAGPWSIAYNMSKQGVTALAKSFAMELGKENIRSNSVHPGAVDTPMTQHHRGGALTAIERGRKENPDLVGMYTTWIHPGTMMSPDEISNAVLYLASDESTFVTGQTLVVDAGVTQY